MCDRQTSKKYTSRGSPPYPANQCGRGTRKLGNDGVYYVTESDKNGTLRWVKAAKSPKKSVKSPKKSPKKSSPSARDLYTYIDTMQKLNKFIKKEKSSLKKKKADLNRPTPEQMSNDEFFTWIKTLPAAQQRQRELELLLLR